MMPLANMRSTIVMFIIVFAILGVLLGFAEAYDTEPTIRLLAANNHCSVLGPPTLQITYKAAG
jgi:hypothetical protein